MKFWDNYVDNLGFNFDLGGRGYGIVGLLVISVRW